MGKLPWVTSLAGRRCLALPCCHRSMVCHTVVAPNAAFVEVTMIKLALSDMDNTLVPFGHAHASDRTVAAIHACQEAGVDFGPASGRDRAELSSFFHGDASCFNTGVLVNGQRVYYLGSIIAEKRLDPFALRRAANIVVSHAGCAFVTYRPNDGFGDWVGATRDALGSMYDRAFMAGGAYHVDGVLPDYPCVKAGVICMGDDDANLALMAEIEEACPGFVCPHTVVHWLDVTPRGVSKEDGVKALMQELRLKPEEIVVFGDADNDLTMLSTTPNSCAVANANERAKAAAHWHIGASADDGVAIALEQIAEAARANYSQGREDIMPAFMTEASGTAA